MRCAGRETRQTGRRDLIGAWLRPNSAVSADRSSVTSHEEETVDMVILGADLHKRWHTVVAVDASTGRKLDEKTIQATPDGHLELCRWAARFPERRWALEDCRHLSRRLEADLLRSGEAVVRVPPKLMAGVRRSVREPGKSDPIDALAVARAALREPGLPVATLDGPERELRLLVDHREDLVAERTRHMQRLRWHLLDLGIAEPGPRSLDRAAGDTQTEAIRALRRRISDEVFRRLRADGAARVTPLAAAA
jgi:transposase